MVSKLCFNQKRSIYCSDFSFLRKTPINWIIVAVHWSCYIESIRIITQTLTIYLLYYNHTLMSSIQLIIITSTKNT